MNKAELLSWLQERYSQWERYLDQIGLARMERPGVNGEWSMKDLLAHLTGWNRWLVDRMQAAQRGQPEPPPPWPAQLQAEDDINAWIYAANHGRPLGEVLEETNQVFQKLFAVIESLPEDARVERIEPAYHLVWVGDQRFEASEFFDHFEDDHEEDVHAWLNQSMV